MKKMKKMKKNKKKMKKVCIMNLFFESLKKCKNAKMQK